MSTLYSTLVHEGYYSPFNASNKIKIKDYMNIIIEEGNVNIYLELIKLIGKMLLFSITL